jgi:hypothetical protein
MVGTGFLNLSTAKAPQRLVRQLGLMMQGILNEDFDHPRVSLPLYQVVEVTILGPSDELPKFIHRVGESGTARNLRIGD